MAWALALDYFEKTAKLTQLYGGRGKTSCGHSVGLPLVQLDHLRVQKCMRAVARGDVLSKVQKCTLIFWRLKQLDVTSPQMTGLICTYVV